MRTYQGRRFIVTTAIAALMIAAPAGAQQRQRQSGDQRQTQSQERGQARTREPQQSRPQETRPQPQGQSQRQAPQRVEPQRTQPQRQAPQRIEPQRPSNDRFRNDRFGSVPNRVVPRTVSRFDGRWIGRTPSIIVTRPFTRVYRPYYSFRPSSLFSFGLSIGYPVAFPSWYDPFAYDGYYYNGYRNPYPSGGFRNIYGGLSFDIQPLDAAIYVDGDYVGTAGDFGPYDAPLTLRSGLHRVEIDAQSCRPVSFDLTVLAGQVIPYRGTLSCY